MKASSKRRRSKAQIQEEKREEERKQNEISKKLAKIAEYEKEMQNLDAIKEEKEGYRKMLNDMFEAGIIK
jgi:hypothetical protein